MLKIPLLVSLGHHGGRRKVASLRPPFSTPLRSLGEPDPETPFLVPIEHAPPLFVRIREDKISLKIYPAPLWIAKWTQWVDGLCQLYKFPDPGGDVVGPAYVGLYGSSVLV